MPFRKLRERRAEVFLGRGDVFKARRVVSPFHRPGAFVTPGPCVNLP
ncbi:hypothetical protein STIAU_5733 [Stigmatella aurantiaca DW4/3-1]|uniref:Uncharacterized protein n=1 Tax=Stigmatella aurantiaca (strain DW4/3-1) TaxID=378806 RepID=Q08XN7_STIAD|nr:hypothetical protein STIAU_5733 [Stigmatella aurantiaca DW4/3-1]